MNTPKRSDSKEKASSPTSSMSLPTPPDSTKELSTSPSQSLSSSAHSLSQPAQHAFDIIKSVKQGRGHPESPWVKLRLEPGDFSLLEERLKVDDLWGYVQDKIRFDYDPQTYVLIFRMPSSTHDIFTYRVVKEIERQLQHLCTNKSRPDVAALARSIECCATSNVYLLSDPDQDYPQHSPDTSFRRVGTGFSSLIIETSFSQKKKDLPRLADNYIIGSHGNIKMVIGLDIEYRRSKRATVSVWESKKGIDEDRVPYLCAEKMVDNKPFRNDDSSPVTSDIALVIPLSIFALRGDAPLLLSQDAVISISYTTLYSFLKDAELTHQETKRDGRSGFIEQLLPGTRLKKRQRTPEEQLKDEDEAQFAANEKEAEKKVDEEDSTWTRKKTRR